MTKPLDEKKFFIIKKEKYSWATNYRIHDTTMYDLTTAVRKLLALDTLNEEKKTTSYHLQEVDLAMVEQPLKLTDEVKEDKSWKDCVDESMPF